MIGRRTDVTDNSLCQGRYTFIKFKASAVCFTNPLRTCRYVGIKTTKSQALQLCEVEIYSRGNSTLIINVIKMSLWLSYMVVTVCAGEILVEFLFHLLLSL